MKYLAFFCKFLCVSILCISCQSNEVQEDVTASYIAQPIIESKIHTDHIGEITFMGDYISMDEYSEEDFIHSINVPLGNKNSVNLYIRAYLDNTLTNHLKKLAPMASIEDLVNHGNYQFTFIVDGQKIYTENLNYGAGSAYSKNQYTSLCIPLYSIEEVDSWGRYMWMRFLHRNGGAEALSQGQHKLEIEIRPYLNIDQLLVGPILAKGAININRNSDHSKIDQELLQVQEIQNSKDINIHSKPLQNQDIFNLNKKIITEEYQDITSVVVLHDGQIALEEYFNGTDRKSLHDTRSVGKSFVGTLLGMAIEDGYIESEMQTLDKFYDLNSFKNYSKEKAKITLKDLLTMSSLFNGSDIDGNSPGHEEKMYPTHDWVKFALDLNTKNPNNNKEWDYFTAGTIILGDILDKTIPKGLEKYAQEKLFDPLSISNYQWQYTPQKVVNTAGGLQLTAIDLAKYGYTYQNEGIWKEKQIINSDWIEKSFTQHKKLPEIIEGHYGYLFWNMEVQVNGQMQEIYYASGNGGNKIFIFKELPYVVVITSTAYNTPYADTQSNSILKDNIIPALEINI